MPILKKSLTQKNMNKIYYSRKLKSEEEIIIELLSRNGDVPYDELVRESGMSAPQVGAILSQLELDGIIRGLGSGKFTLVQS